MGNTTADSRWELVQRVLDSPQFQKSPRLREFVSYACERMINNQLEDLREQRIGCEVFGRKPCYNPADDNIVRVEARNVRKRLDEYFASDGKSEPIVITIPKGAYVPLFQARHELAGMEPTPVAPPVTAASGAISMDSRKFNWIGAFQPALIVMLAAACIWLLVLRQRDNSAARRDPLWTQLFDDTHETFIVCADSALVLMEDLTHHQVPLSDYVNRKYLPDTESRRPEMRDILGLLLRKQYTSIGDVHLVEKLLLANEHHLAHVSVRSSRKLQLDDFKTSNLILLGSPRSTPWEGLFDQQLNFRFEMNDSAGTQIVRNRAPRKGEQSVYRTGSSNGGPDLAWSTVAYLPNLSHTGSVLILSGTGMEGTEAAGEFLTNREFYRDLVRQVGLAPGKIGYFEALLKSNIVGGSSRGSEVVAYRLIR